MLNVAISGITSTSPTECILIVLLVLGSVAHNIPAPVNAINIITKNLFIKFRIFVFLLKLFCYKYLIINCIF